MSDRPIVIGRDGIALAELADGDRDVLAAGHDGAFDVDPDNRPPRYVPRPHRLAVVDQGTGELLGQVNWHAVGYGATAACEAWNIGRVLLPAARGRGVGTLALRLLVEHLFATTTSTASRPAPRSRTTPPGGPWRRSASSTRA